MTDLRPAFEEFCRQFCSPGAATSDFYWRLFQAGAEAQRRADSALDQQEKT